MKSRTALLLFLAVTATFSPKETFGEDKKITIDSKDTTSEWVMMFDRGVDAGKRLNSFCKERDYVGMEIDGEKFQVCRSFKVFMNTKQFTKAPPPFQLGFLSGIK